jgi:hypothetical protein
MDRFEIRKEYVLGIKEIDDQHIQKTDRIWAAWQLVQTLV